MARRRDDDRPLYMISVAAELAGVHPQTLRIYERKRLICPQRSGGNTRLYSDADIDRLRSIQHLTQDEGVNLAGVMRIIELERELDRTRAELDATRAQLEVLVRATARARQQTTSMVRVQSGGIVRRHVR